MYNGYDFSTRKEPTRAQAYDELHKVRNLLGEQKFNEWVKINFTLPFHYYTNQIIIAHCTKAILDHECHCNGAGPTCEVCQSKALAATDQEIPY